MEQLKQWAVMICAVAVLCAMLHMLAPNSKMEKPFKLVLGLFFLCCFFSPLLIDITSFAIAPESVESSINKQSNTFSETVQKQVEEAFKKKISGQIEAILKDFPVKTEKINVLINTTEGGGIYITQIEIFIQADFHLQDFEDIKNKLEEKVQQNFGVIPVVCFQE